MVVDLTINECAILLIALATFEDRYGRAQETSVGMLREILRVTGKRAYGLSEADWDQYINDTV